MQDGVTAHRNPWFLSLVCLVLGPGAAFLWIGRGVAAVVYSVLANVLAILGVLLIIQDIIPPHLMKGTSILSAIYVAAFPVYIIGFFHVWRANAQGMRMRWFSRWYVAFPLFLLVNVVAAFTTRLAFHPFSIPSEASAPTLLPGDYLVISNLAYRNREPARGEIVVFKVPVTRVYYVKRLIGLPGDRIRMVKGQIELNGELVPQTPVTMAPEFYDGELPPEIRYFRETLPGGASYIVANLQDDGVADNTEEYVVPEGHYFMLGDNRDNSQDSRFLDKVGYIPRADLEGPLLFKYFSNNGYPMKREPVGEP